ncbi:hypothetical protein FA13DRAFT_1113838 [Coprinellus micaceus]|uniref:Uncharacterized protein n=1 Tax=Coprinellus micaceus TaxID=71717 RepID=A0A4Y7RKG6_COPMI|nr:hypothetical protein FA13DRAFT_1113838 [Coprinellus micaceus]
MGGSRKQTPPIWRFEGKEARRRRRAEAKGLSARMSNAANDPQRGYPEQSRRPKLLKSPASSPRLNPPKPQLSLRITIMVENLHCMSEAARSCRPRCWTSVDCELRRDNDPRGPGNPSLSKMRVKSGSRIEKGPLARTRCALLIPATCPRHNLGREIAE